MDWSFERWRNHQVRTSVLAMAVVCPLLLLMNLGDAKRQYDSRSWPQVEGVIERTTVSTWLNKDKKTLYFGRPVYRYTVAGKEYKTDLTELSAAPKRETEQMAQADVARYRPGDKVIVYYDPADPSVGLLVKGITPLHKSLLIFLGIGSAIGIAGSVPIVRSWIQARRRPAEAPQETSDVTPSLVRQGLRDGKRRPAKA